MADYRSLDPPLQNILELFAVVDSPVSRTTGLEYVRAARIVGSQATRITPHAWKPIVEILVGRDLLLTNERQIECNDEIADGLCRAADRKGNLRRWVQATEAVERTFYRRSEGTYRSYYYEKNSLFADLRLSAHLNQPDIFESRCDVLFREFARDESYRDLFESLFNRPFDAEWLGTRAKGIRETAISFVVPAAHDRLIVADDAIRLLEQGPVKEDGFDWRRQLIIEHHLLKGNIQTVRNWLPGNSSPQSAIYSGWQLCIRGEYEKAVEQFEFAADRIKAATRKRDILFNAVEGAFFVIALLGTSDATRLRRAVKYIDLAIRKIPGESALYECLRSATEVADGKRNASVDRTHLDQAEDLPALYQILIYTAACWADRKRARACLRHIEAMRSVAKAGGYAWAAAEFAQIRARLLLNEKLATSAGEEHHGLGTAPLLNAIRNEAPWQRGLRGLSRLSDKVGPTRVSQGSASRLVWRIEADSDQPAVLAFEQKLSKAGRWSKGKAVPLKRLHARDNLGFITLQDERVCQSISEDPSGTSRHPSYQIDAGRALAGLAGHPLVFRMDSPATRMEIVRKEPELRVTATGRNVKIQLVPEPPQNGSALVTAESPTRLLVTPFDQSHREILDVVGPGGLQAPATAQDEVVEAVSSVSALVTVHSDIGGSAGAATEMDADSTPRFHLTPFESGLRVEPLVRPFVNDGPVYAPGKGGDVVFATIAGKQTMARRRLAEEKRRHRDAVASCSPLLGARWDGSGWTVADPVECLELLDHLHSLGDGVAVAWPKGESMRIRHRPAENGLSLKIRRKRNWFDIDGELKLDSGRVISLMELLERIGEAQGRFLPLGDKGFVALSDRFREQAEELAALVERHNSGLRFHDARVPVLESIVEGAGRVDADQVWKGRLQRFREAQALNPDVPSTLRADLRDYQVQGFRWAARLAAWGAGACLADDMGLGKTIQALTVAVARAPQGPALVVAPTSVCPNWIEEARRFAPTLRPVQFGPGDRQKTLKSAGPFDLIVSSYGLLYQEADLLAGVEWQMIVLDEAQAIKNRQTMRSRAAMRLGGEFRMITTGTPIENDLGELWNLFHFINPGLLGSAESFNRRFASPIHNRQSDTAKRHLKRLIQPFTLRRTKSAVLDELPARTEITVRVEMTERESEFYEAVRLRAVSAVGELQGNGGKSHLRILAEIMRLRRACCHPRLLAPEIDITGSKLETFSQIVTDLMNNGHKALVFSQFVDHLSIVRSRLDQLDVSYRYLDGSTPAAARTREVNAFQAGEADLFLISLRAGGQGLNLTAADYVLHLDPWWNPAVEDQASDRAHRIGQTRPVTIYRLVMKDTIEERIVDLHATKRDLADSLLEGSDMAGKMSADELLALLRET